MISYTFLTAKVDIKYLCLSYVISKQETAVLLEYDQT